MEKKLVKRYFAYVSIIGTEEETENGMSTGWITFLESHPYVAPFQAEQYLERHADKKGFEYGSIQEKYITHEKEQELLSKKEEVYPYE